MIRKISVLLIVLVAMVSCDSARQGIGSAYNMVNCKYTYKSISGLSVGGANFSNGFNAASILSLTNLLTGGNKSSIPVNFTVNMNVNNPNATEAALSGLQYVISVDNVELTTGMVNNALSIASGETQMLPLSIGFDLATFMQGENKDTMLNAIKNIAGIGSKQSNISVKIKPTFMVGNYPVTSPIYIPVNFTIGK